MPPVVVRVPADGPGFARAVNAAGGREDLLLVGEDVVLAAGAPERLLEAARDTTVATVSAMHDGGPWAPLPLRDPAVAAASSGRHRPRLPSPSGGCVLVRRWALDLTGPFDAAFATAEATLADFGARCTVLGVSHVLADDVLVRGPWRWTDAGDDARLDADWPHRAAFARSAGDPEAPVRRALQALRARARPISVTVDGRALGPAWTGTQVHALELSTALARTGRLDVRVLVAADLNPDAAAALAAEPAITTLTYEDAAHGDPEPTDVVHRPAQVFTPADLALLVGLGHRLVVSHQDLIAFHTPRVHASPVDWERFRRTTRVALGTADHVAFFSEHALHDALSEALVAPERASVVPIGVDHQAVPVAVPRRPAGLPATDRPFLLCLGADLPHKNLGFAHRLLEELRAGGWEGDLVLAGPGSALGAVDEAEKAWLLRHAALVVYPTLYEGFGLVPFEAAAAGVPCAWAPVASLAEVLPPELATLVPWDAAASAVNVRRVLEDPQGHVRRVLAAGERYRWDATAAAFVALYERLLAVPGAEAVTGPRERLRLLEELDAERRARIREWQVWRARIGEDAVNLVGPDGVLTPEEQRALLALASKPALRRAVIRPMRAAYEVVKRRA